MISPRRPTSYGLPPRRLTTRATTARTLTALALAAGLSACGGSGTDSVASAPEPSSAAPSAATSSPACPLTATEVPAPAGATTDLATKPVVKPSTTPPPTGVQYADLVVGDGAEAVTGSQVKVKYVGALYQTGKEFDSSWSRGADETLPFGICQQGVIPGFAVGPSGMKVGGRRLITIPSQLGYGEAGSPPAIPGGAALVFVVDLVKVG